MSADYLFGQLVLGLISGSFYALLSLGIALIFGLLRIANFVHGAQYMLGAFCALGLLQLHTLGIGLPQIGYWGALVIVPLVVGIVGVVMERLLIRRTYRLDHAYGLLLTVGLALVIEGLLAIRFGSTGQSYPVPPSLRGGLDLGFVFLPVYRAWIILASIAVCLAVWLAIERTPLGARLRAATENPTLVEAFGINVPRLLTFTYGLGVGLAGLAGVMAAPVYSVSAFMGQNIIITVFAIVVIGGMGSIAGAVVSGFALGIIEGLTKAFYPEASSTVIFLVMALVLVLRPAGLFGREVAATGPTEIASSRPRRPAGALVYALPLLALGIAAPSVLYPLFVMKIMCMALFACAYNLLFGFAGLLAFGHAAFFGAAAYVTGATILAWNLPPELAIVLGVLTAGLLGLGIGALAIRRQGIYFAMITLALAQIVYFALLQSPWTGGENGLQSIPRGMLFGVIDLARPGNMYGFVLVVFVASFMVLHRTMNSPFGTVLKAIRQNEARALSLGYRTDRYKLLAFVISAAFAGLAGSMKALVLQLVTLADPAFGTSGDVLLMALIGGAGSVIGPVLGAVTLVSAQELLAPYGAWVLVLQGIIFVACVLVLRDGIVGALAQLGATIRSRVLRRSEIRSPSTSGSLSLR